MKGRRTVVFAALGAMVTAAAASAAAWRRHELSRAGIHVTCRTMSGPALVFDLRDDDGSPLRVLWVDGILQSGTYVDDRRYVLAFSYLESFDLGFIAPTCARRVLMLGGGGCSWPRHVVATRPAATVDVVEVDPAIARIARRHFFVDEAMREHPGRLGLHVADGRDFLGRVGEPYDVIANDCFSGRVPAASLVTAEAARLAHDALAPDGRYLTNVVSATKGESSALLRCVVATLETAFAHVHVIPCAGPSVEPDNVIVLATDADLSYDGELALGTDPDAPEGIVLTDANVDSVLLALGGSLD